MQKTPNDSNTKDSAFFTSKATPLNLPFAVLIGTLPQLKSGKGFHCSAALIGANHSGHDTLLSMLDRLANPQSIREGEKALQATQQFWLGNDNFEVWHSTLSTIRQSKDYQAHNAKLACYSTQVFFLFGDAKDCADLNATHQYLQQLFPTLQTCIIDYSSARPTMKPQPANAAFQEDQLHPLVAPNQDTYIKKFTLILQQLDKKKPTHDLIEETSRDELVEASL